MAVSPGVLRKFSRSYDPQKPSLGRVAVFAFQSLDSYRDRMSQNMNRKHEKHTVTPLQKEVTDRLAMYAASLGRVYTAGGFLSNIGGTHGARPTGRRVPTPVTRSLARNDSAAALTGRRTPRAFVPLHSTVGRRPLRIKDGRRPPRYGAVCGHGAAALTAQDASAPETGGARRRWSGCRCAWC